MTSINFKAAAMIATATILAGCGDSSGETPATPTPPTAGPTPQTTVGKITGFGSVYVNGVRYDTSGAQYDVDDMSASDDDALAVGMIVKVQGSLNADGQSGSASHISYDDEIEGVVSNLMTDAMDANIKTFDVMGVLVQTSSASTNFESEYDASFSFETIMDGDNVEVSGEYSGDVLIASYVEEQDAADDEYEAKGIVDQFAAPNMFTLILRNESTIFVTVADGAETPDAGIMDGQYVEVEGTIPDPVNAPNDLLATKVELEDSDRISDSDDDHVEVKGALNYDMETLTWSVMEVALEFNSDTEYSPESLEGMIDDMSASGLMVEVEGTYVNDILVVDEIELEEEDLEFKATVAAINSADGRNGTITLSFGVAIGTIDVDVTPDTMFVDDDAMSHYDLNSLMGGDKIELKARMTETGAIVATALHLEDDLGFEIEGPVDSIDDTSITILGIIFGIDMNTMFIGAAPTMNDYAEVEDEDGDGVADQIELED